MNEEEPIQALRDELAAAIPIPVHLPRPVLSKAEQINLSLLARKINAIQDEKIRLSYIGTFLLENAQLTLEINTLRVHLGFEAIASYSPINNREHHG